MNYIEKLKELRDKATPGPWYVEYAGKDSTLRYDHSPYATENDIADCTSSIFQKYNFQDDSDLEIVEAMRNSLDLWLELAEAAHHLERLVASNLLTNKHPKYRVQRVLAKLRGEHE